MTASPSEPPPSAIAGLLDELSWEGNARKYRGGGRGLENVLTAEVFQALDFLPRGDFLAPVLAACTPSVPMPAAAEDLQFEILPGDRSDPRTGIKVQPDVLLTSASHYLFVEAKAIAKNPKFQRGQLAREALVTAANKDERSATLLLVLGAPPPIAVAGRGRLSIADELSQGLADIRAGYPQIAGADGLDTSISWITWQQIAEVVAQSASDFANESPSVAAGVQRLAGALTQAVHRHAVRG